MMQKACFDFKILMMIDIGDHHAKTLTKSHESLGFEPFIFKGKQTYCKMSG
jgi:hypothetical protein